METSTKGILSFVKLTEQNVRRNVIVQIIIATLAFICFVRIWPMGLVKEHTVSKQQAMATAEYTQDALFVAPDKKLQGVWFAQDHLYQITLYMSCVTYEKDDYVIFRLYNDKFSCIYEENILCNLIMREGALIATPDMDVVPEQDYYYEILIPEYDMTWRTVTEQLILPIALKEQLGQEEHQILYIDGIYNDQEALIADFDYTKPMPAGKIVMAGVFIVLASVAGYFCCTLLLGKFLDCVRGHGRYLRWMATAGAVVSAGVVFTLVVIKNVFGGSPLDRVVYGVGTLTALGCGLCAVWYALTKRLEPNFTVGKKASLLWRNYLQTVFWGLAVYSTCQYVNADREYFHITNKRWMLIFLGLAFLMIYSERVLCNIFSYLWLGVSFIGSFIYFYLFAQGDAEELYVVKLTSAAVIIWGLVIVNVLLQVKKDFWKRISKPFFAVWLFFLGLMIYWRAERTWIFTATLPFAVLLLYNLSATARVRVLKNFTNGVFVSFALYLLYSMHHRPYNAWLLYRYGGIFHTVASTGMYLSLVAAVALGRLFGKWKKQENMLADGWKELVLFVVSVSGIMLTMSRTAMLTTAVNFVIVFVVAALIYKKRVMQLCK